MENNIVALIGAVIAAIVSLIVGVLNSIVILKKNKADEPQIKANVSKILTDASVLLLNELQENQREMRKEIEELKAELRVERDLNNTLREENKKLSAIVVEQGIRIKDLEEELKEWKNGR